MVVGQHRWHKAYRHLVDTQGRLPEGAVETDRGVYHHHHLHLPPFMFKFAQCAHCTVGITGPVAGFSVFSSNPFASSLLIVPNGTRFVLVLISCSSEFDSLLFRILRGQHYRS
jgi:hypothetical protein